MAQPLTATAVALLLEAFLEAERARLRPMDWPQNNCCHYADRWLHLLVGREVIGALASVTGPRQARRRAPAGLGARFAGLVGDAGLPGALAQLGDVVLVPVPASTARPTRGMGLGEALGVCGGRVVWLLGVDGQPSFLPLSHALRCWPLRSMLERACAG